MTWTHIKEEEWYNLTFALEYKHIKDLIMSYIRTSDSNLFYIIYQLLPERKETGHKQQIYKEFSEKIHAMALVVKCARQVAEKLDGDDRKKLDASLSTTIRELEYRVEKILERQIKWIIRIKNDELKKLGEIFRLNLVVYHLLNKKYLKQTIMKTSLTLILVIFFSSFSFGQDHERDIRKAKREAKRTVRNTYKILKKRIKKIRIKNRKKQKQRSLCCSHGKLCFLLKKGIFHVGKKPLITTSGEILFQQRREYMIKDNITSMMSGKNSYGYVFMLTCIACAMIYSYTLCVRSLPT